ncbi:MAG: helix-turn-helix domain-containing protein [Dehalococcoidia bacterium]
MNVIGERLKQARHRAGLTTRQLGERAGVSAQAVSKYERGLNVPGSAVLLRLGAELGARTEFFFRPTSIGAIVPAFRRCAPLSKHDVETLVAQIRDWLERYLLLESLLDHHAGSAFIMPEGLPRPAASAEDAECAADRLRAAWELGSGPIGSLTEVLEERGIKVEPFDAPHDVDACMFWAETHAGRIPIVALNRNMSGERQRFSLGHELGHLFLQTTGGADEQKLANRFAAAFLVPGATARRELGERRHALDLYELHLLKHRYGMSMQAWARRARDLDIITGAERHRLRRLLTVGGDETIEPGDQYPSEQSSRMERLVMQALAEDAIGETRAGEILGRPVREFLRCAADVHGGFPFATRRR